MSVRYEKLSQMAGVEIRKGSAITKKTATEGTIKVIAGGTSFAYMHNIPNRPANTITVSASGANAGYVNFWSEPIFASDCTTVRGTDDAETEFLYWVLKSKQDEIQAMAKGAAQPHVYPDDIGGIQIPVLSPAIRSQIAARLKAQLAEVDTARQAVQAQLRDAELLRQRLLQHAFDALVDAPRKTLGEYAATTSGSTPSRGDKRYWSPREIPWVKTGEVAFAPITCTEEAISKLALSECSLTLLPPQTVLIAMYGQGKTRGQSAILEIEATTNQACFAILPNDTWDVDFLYHWFMSSYENLRNLSDGRGGNQANLNGNLLNALKIPAPDLDEQRRIVAALKAQLAETGTLRTALQNQQRDLEALPQRILAQAFEN